MNLSNPDFLFARDLIQFVIQIYRPDWKFLYGFSGEVPNSHLKENLSSTIKDFIEENDVNIQRDYEEAFKGTLITFELFRSVGKELLNEIYHDEKEFCVKIFLGYCGIFAKYTFLSFILGLNTAPYHAVVLIVDAMQHLRQIGIFTDESWHNIHMYTGDI